MKIVVQQNPKIEKDIDEICVPDLWGIAMAQENEQNKETILECWHLCHSLKNALRDID